MKKMILVLLMVMVCSMAKGVTFIEGDRIIRDTVRVKINGEFRNVNIKRLIEMTQVIESSGGLNNFKGRIAKSSYQYEMATVDHYKKLPLIKDIWNNIEDELGRKLNPLKEEDAKYVTYIIYFAKIYYHKNLLLNNKFFEETGDVEWCIYKTLWNSSKGASTYEKWVQRTAQYEAEKLLYAELGSELYNSVSKIG